MDKKKLTLGTVVLGFLAILGFAAYNSQNTTGGNTSPNHTVSIAANVPLTGDLGVYGVAFRDGSMMAKEDLEKKSPDGPKLVFDWQDNAFDQKTTLSVMQKQYIKAPDIYLSALKPQTLAINDQVAAKGTPHFEWILDINPNKSNAKKNNFRTWVSFKYEAQVFLDYAKSKNAKRVAVVYFRTPAAEEEYTQVVVPGLKKQGTGDVLVEPFDTDQTDYKNIAAKFKAFNPDLVIMNGFIPQMVGIIRAMRPLGLIKEGNTLGSIDLLDAANVLSPAESEGIIVAAPTFITRPDEPKLKIWRQSFEKKYNKEPVFHNAYAYDMTQIIYEAAKRLQLPASSQQWIKAIQATDMEGVTGALRFDGNGSLITTMEPAVYRKGKLIPLK